MKLLFSVALQTDGGQTLYEESLEVKASAEVLRGQPLASMAQAIMNALVRQADAATQDA